MCSPSPGQPLFLLTLMSISLSGSRGLEFLLRREKMFRVRAFPCDFVPLNFQYLWNKLYERPACRKNRYHKRQLELHIKPLADKR
jgi:hypothetical protein